MLLCNKLHMMCADRLFKVRYDAAVDTIHHHDMSAVLDMLHTNKRGPTLDYASQVYKRKRSKTGRIFESVLEDMLRERGISFISQVSHDANGVICAKKRGYVHDIIIDAKIGEPLKNKIVISCKTSLRERYKQDAKIPCRKMFMVTLEKVTSTEKYASTDIQVVSIGHENALENMFVELEVDAFVSDLFNLALIPLHADTDGVVQTPIPPSSST